MKIGLIVGSLREDSYNMQIAKAVEDMLDGDVKAEIIDIKNIPFYNADLEGDIFTQNLRGSGKRSEIMTPLFSLHLSTTGPLPQRLKMSST